MVFTIRQSTRTHRLDTMGLSEYKMGSIIYTYQKSKRKPIPLTDERIQTLKDHEKFLKSHRVGESRIVSEEVITPDCRSGDHGFEPRTVRHSPKKPIGKVAGTKPVNNWRLEESQNFTVAPAYNKGAYQVITKSNIKDIGR